MAKIISIHSFRGGTGKSNTTANLAALLAVDGQRVGVIDTDIQSPGIHVLFGLKGATISHSLNDYLWGHCTIRQAAHDVTDNLGAQYADQGKLFLIPSSIQADAIVNVLREGYDVGLLTSGIRNLINELQLDVLLIDTHPGLNEETLFSIAISHALLIIMRPDQQDYEGTGVTVEVARSLDVPNMLLLVNKVPAAFDPNEIRTHVQQTFQCDVAGVLPHVDEMMTLASGGIFALRYPDHPLTQHYRELSARLSA
ncbi:MAG TPA: MinD/ParA family protein [Caldilineaceae bacterium]|nr:MinD/ParA family protein [Caldilineaceae bacterium]